MSYPNHNNHGGSSRPSHNCPNSQSGSSYAEHGLSLNATSTYLNSTFTSLNIVPNDYQNPYPPSHGGSSYTNQTPHYGQQNVRALPAPDNGQPDRHQEDVPQPIESVGEQGILQDPRLNLPHHGMEGYRPLILGDPVAAVPPYAFQNVELAQGVPPQGQADPLEREHDLVAYAPQHVIPGPAQAAFHPSFVYQVPIPDQPGEDNLRRLARRFLCHADSRVNMVRMEPGAAGRFKVVIVLEAPDVL